MIQIKTSAPGNFPGGIQNCLIVIVGGDRCPAHIARLECSFPNHQFIHCTTRENDASSKVFKNYLIAKSVCFVVMVVGLARTQHSRDVHSTCRRLRIPVASARRIPHPNMLGKLIELRSQSRRGEGGAR